MGACVATLCCGGGALAQTDPKPIDPAGWITNEDYPPAALEKGVDGTVAIRLDVDATGRATGCVATGGGPLLDDATCGIVMLRARFEPARDAVGSPVTSTVPLRFRWEKPFDADTYLILSAWRVRLTIGPDHAIEGCELWRSYDRTSSPQSCDVVTGMMRSAAGWAQEHEPGVLDRIERTSIEGVPDVPFAPALEVAPNWTRTMRMTVDDRGRVTVCRMVEANRKKTRCPGRQRFLASPGRRPMVVLSRVSEAFRPTR